MNDVLTSPIDSAKRFQFGWIKDILIRPRQAFEKILQQPKGVWLTPMIVLTVTTLCRVIVAGWLQGQAAAMGEIQFPMGWEYYTPDQQAQYMQTTQATQGPVFNTVLPGLGNLLMIWVGWLLVGGLLHLVLTLFGGRGTTQAAMNIVAWSGTTWAVRDLVRVAYMLIAGKQIMATGISGFASPASEGFGLFMAALLSYVDLYLVWHIVLIGKGIQAGNDISKGKATFSAALTVTLIILLWTLVVFLVSSVSDLAINRPFFF